MYSRILVTGGHGFVARFLKPLLLTRFPRAEFLQTVRRPSPRPTGIWREVVVDLTDRERAWSVISGFRPDLVVHLAAESSVQASELDAWRAWQANVDAVSNITVPLQEYSRDVVFLYVSSSEVYGRAFRGGVVDETVSPSPIGAYAKTKIAAEYCLHNLLPSSARLIVVRPFNHSGETQSERFVLPSIARKIVDIESGIGDGNLYVGNLDVRREFLYVGEVCRAYMNLLDIEWANGCRETFNIATGRTYAIREIIDIYRNIAKCEFTIVQDKNLMRSNEILDAKGCSHRLLGLTGWVHQIEIDILLERILNYWRSLVGL